MSRNRESRHRNFEAKVHKALTAKQDILERGHEIQQKLADKVIFEDNVPKPICTVAGVDAAYIDGKGIGAVAVLNIQSLLLVESKIALGKVSFPYIPTLLGFRENPIAIKAVGKLKTKPDVFMVDGHGVAHPYGCGFACQFGLSIKKPTIGVAKNLLHGEIAENVAAHETRYLRFNREIIGAAVVTNPGSKPVFVSVGNMISLATAIEIVRKCTCSHRVPEPLRAAHLIAATEKRKIQIGTACSNRRSEETC